MARHAKRMGSKADLEAKMIRGAMVGMQAWVDLASQDAQGLAPVDTGRLARSIHPDPAGVQELESNVYTTAFGTNVEYARAHELGSGIHSLDPSERQLILIQAGAWNVPPTSDKKALAFAWPGGPKPHPAFDPETGKYVFRSILHPGVRSYPDYRGYLRRAAHESLDKGKRLVTLAITAEWRKTR